MSSRYRRAKDNNQWTKAGYNTIVYDDNVRYEMNIIKLGVKPYFLNKNYKSG